MLLPPHLPQDLPRRLKVFVADLKLGQHEPYLGEGEGLVRNHVQARPVHLAAAAERGQRRMREQAAASATKQRGM